MAASFTCHRHVLSGAYPYTDGPVDGVNASHNNGCNSRPLPLVPPALASPPLATNIASLPPLNIPSHPSSPGASSGIAISSSPGLKFQSLLEVAEITVDTCASPSSVSNSFSDEEFPEMESRLETSSPGLKAVKASSGQDSSRTQKRKRTRSPPSPSSKHIEDRTRPSTRRSTPTSRRSSIHSHHRLATNPSLTPASSPGDTESKRENLLALHRESCRLFQDPDITKPTPSERRTSSSLSPSPRISPTLVRSSSEAPPSPISSHPPLITRVSLSQDPEKFIQETRNSPLPPHPPIRAYSAPTNPHDVDHIQPTQQAPATVIDWTSPSTRRREYEKIDRASTGVRGFWRRVAPRWCQFGDNRMPFFEEKDGRPNYEGSVRRFRMDIPEPPAGSETKLSSYRGLKLKKSLAVKGRRNR